MRKLILFLVRYNTAFLFILLQAVAFLFIYRTLSYQRSTMFAANAEWSGKILATYNNVDDYLNLAQINRNLAKENAILNSTNKASYFSLTSIRDTIVDTLLTQQYTYLEARVINSSFRKRNNYITIDKGSIHGIKPDMAVTSSQGVIGVVKDVSAHFSSIIPLIHGRSLVSAGFENNSHFGTLNWNGKDFRYAQLKDVPREAPIQVGDPVLSDTRSLSFPGGLLIGKIASFELDVEEQTYDIEVELAVNFSSIDFVYVIDNLLQEEQEQLELLQQAEE